MNAPASIPVTPVLVADLTADGEPMPLYVHVMDHVWLAHEHEPWRPH